MISKEAETALEAEHGPCVVLTHPDGHTFVFKRMTRDQFVVRNNRLKRGEADADDSLLQERCVAEVECGGVVALEKVMAGRDGWNKYAAAAVFQLLAFGSGYRNAHGGDGRKADSDEIPKDGDAALWIAAGAGPAKRVFPFRKPGRAEVKMFQAGVMAERNGDKRQDGKSPLEALLLALGGADFAAWLEDNLFAIESFGEVLVTAFGMADVSASGKI